MVIAPANSEEEAKSQGKELEVEDIEGGGKMTLSTHTPPVYNDIILGMSQERKRSTENTKNAQKEIELM